MKVLSILWHSVEPDSINPDFLTGSNPTASLFREQIEYIVDNYTPISIREFVDLIGTPSVAYRGTKPPVLLTFDDGFKNVVDQALPILTEFGIPAVFFVVGSIAGNPGFIPWFVESTHLIRRTTRRIVSYRNESLDLSGSPGRRRVTELLGINLSMSRADDDRERALTNLAELLRVDRPTAADLDEDLRFVGPEELAKLGSSSLLTVASHAMTHRYLDTLTREEQSYELKQSHVLLSRCSPSYFPALAYPGGSFNADTLSVAKETYKCAFATSFGSKRNSYAYLRIGIGRDTSQHVAYAISPRRLRYVIPLKRLLAKTVKWR
jgi:peptidoglycan/xylan/chitin deacetylase (PgdA/CDA1 family)